MTAGEGQALLQVVAGVVLNEQGEYLLSSRPAGKAYAGYWEFAGGKVEPGESELEALKREFEEELGIHIHHARPWLTKIYAYEHAHVHLRFFRVEADQWSGTLQAKEGQGWSWQRPGDFDVSPMLPANDPILAALAIPTALSGDVETGFVGCHAQGDYRVVPFARAEAVHRNVLLSEAQLQQYGRLPEADSVWVVIDRPERFERVQDADVVVMLVCNEQDADWVCRRLQDGVSQPLVVCGLPEWVAAYGARWLAAGAHAVLEHRPVAFA